MDVSKKKSCKVPQSPVRKTPPPLPPRNKGMVLPEYADFFDETEVVNDSGDEGDVADAIEREERELFSGFIAGDGDDDDDGYLHPNPYVSPPGSPVPSETDSCFSSQSSRSSGKRGATHGDGVSPVKSKVGGARAVNWCFTVNSYDDDDVEAIMGLYPENCEYVIIGKEVGETGNRHLQGYVKFTERKRFNQVKVLFNTCNPHIEKCKGSPAQNIEYCSKGGDVRECGERPIVTKKPQKMQRCIEHILNKGSIEDIAFSDLCHVYVTNESKIHSVVSKIRDERKNDEMREQSRRHLNLTNFLPWECEINKMIETQLNTSDERTINWFCDKAGGVGKTKYLRKLKMADEDGDMVLLHNDPDREVKFMYEGQRRVFFDIPRRVKSDVINYELIETLKDGNFMSFKYVPKFKFYKRPVIAVFANTFPEISSMSIDRWNIFEMEKDPTGNVHLRHRNPYDLM